jgi:hypothetical protein
MNSIHSKKRFLSKEYRKGYIALFSVIVLGAVSLVIAVSVLSTGVTASKFSFNVEEKIHSRIVSASCAEEVLQQILDTGIDSGSGSMSIASGDCSYSIIQTGLDSLRLHVEGAKGGAISRLRIEIASSTPRIKLSSWQEVSSF